jgi:hypothetical protein
MTPIDTSNDWTISTGVTGGPPPPGITINDCYAQCDSIYPNDMFSWVTGNTSGDKCYAACATQYGVSLAGQAANSVLCGLLPFNIGCGSEVPNTSISNLMTLVMLIGGGILIMGLMRK